MSASPNVLTPRLLWDVPLVARGTPTVVVHGSRGRPEMYLEAFAPLTRRHGLPLLIPDFTEGDQARHGSLAFDGAPMAAVRYLDEAVDLLADRLGRPIHSVDLVGFSGGAQFAHRLALLRPGLVRRLVVAAAGWYTMLDPSRPFPLGCAASAHTDWAKPYVPGLLDTEILILVGERDIRRGPSLRTGPELDAEQGEHRLARAIRWHRHLGEIARELGVKHRARFELMPRTGHSFPEAMSRGGLGSRAIEFLTSLPPTGLGDEGLPDPRVEGKT